MTETAPAVASDQPQHLSKIDKSAKVSGKNKIAIDAMVMEGLNRRDAAARAGLTDHSLYVALSKPHCKAYYLAQLEVLRTSERARNLHRLAEIRDAGNNMPAVQAIGMLERLSVETQGRSGASVSAPGLTVMIVNAPSQPMTDTQLTHKPRLINEINE